MHFLVALFFFCLPALFDPLEVLKACFNLANLLWVELEHGVAEFQHPCPSLLAGINFDTLGIGDLNLSCAERADGETIPF